MPALGIATNYFSTNHAMTTCGASVPVVQGEVLSFGFLAQGLRIVNTCTDKLFFTLAEEAATTGSAFIAGCGILQLDGSIKISGIGLASTSTTTSGGSVARPQVSVIAWSA
jgi:hypothetical protein